jgi:hypothetical protein
MKKIEDKIKENQNFYHNKGLAIISLLGLKIKKRGEEKGRVNTTWGTKTPEGISRTMERVMDMSSEELENLI